MKEAVLQVRMDSQLKEQVEELYKNMGTTFSEAVRIFAKQSLIKNAIPFEISALPNSNNKKVKLGIADGKYSIPDDIDDTNEAIAKMFGMDL